MHVSIAVTTLNRAGFLQQLFDALENQSYQDFEVIVVDGPSTDNTQALVEQYSSRVKYFRISQADLGKQRNLGIMLAKGEIVAYIDDDAIPSDNDWVRNAVRYFEQDPDLAGVGGSVTNHYSHIVEFAKGYVSSYGFQIFDGKAVTKVPRDFFLRLTGCNMFFRKKALLKIGGFDLAYRYYADETDVCMRLLKSEQKLAVVEDIGVIHYKPEKETGRNYRSIFNISRSDTYFALRHGNNSWPIRFLKTIYYAPKKHFVVDIFGHRDLGVSDSSLFALQVFNWLRGVIAGYLIYLTHSTRKVELVDMSKDFKPFKLSVID